MFRTGSQYNAWQEGRGAVSGFLHELAYLLVIPRVQIFFLRVIVPTLVKDKTSH